MSSFLRGGGTYVHKKIYHAPQNIFPCPQNISHPSSLKLNKLPLFPNLSNPPPFHYTITCVLKLFWVNKTSSKINKFRNHSSTNDKIWCNFEIWNVGQYDMLRHLIGWQHITHCYFWKVIFDGYKHCHF